MTLEDFFTLTEMKNGLTTPARVEELISMIQRQKACTTNHCGDTTRQWSIVASTLAATENQDCLNHFVYLNGLYFFNQWLHEAVKCSQQVLEAEELINILLGSLEKLPVDWKKLRAAGILKTIEKLFGHDSTDIKSRAITLFERWNNRRINDDVCDGIDKGCLNHVDSSKSSVDAESGDDKHANNLNVGDSQCKTLVVEDSYREESANNDIKLSPSNNLQSDNTVNLSMEPSVAPVGMASSSALVSTEVQVKSGDEYIISAHKNDDEMDAEMSIEIGDSYESGQRESLCVLSSTSPTASLSAKKPMLEGSASLILESMEDNPDMLEPGETNHSCTSDGKIQINESTLKACKEVDTFTFGDHSRTSKFEEELDKKLDSALDSGEFDALEVARLVAIEVEREVVDYREQSCSSSTNVSSRDIASSANPDFTENNKQDNQIIGEPNGDLSVVGIDYSDTATFPKDDSSKLSELATNLKPEIQRLESPDHTHKSSSRSMRPLCEFDLNADALPESIDTALYHIPSNPNNLSTPIAISASKGAPEWAVTPLHLEGDAGWKGSAATSAFRPASPRRTPDCEKANPGSKLKANLIEIDLNVADCESDVAVDPSVFKQLPGSYCNLSRDSSVEVSSGRAVRIQLDLNSAGNDEAPSLQSSILSHHHQKGSTSLSPTSSSSSLKPSMRNFDLNDNPITLDGISNSITYGVGYNDPFFSIMGAKVPVVRRDHANQSHQAWMSSGLNWDTVMAGRPLMPYVNQVPQPSYAYNGLGMMPAFPFQPVPYTHSSISHMAETRSTAIMPQLMGSTSTHGAPILPAQPFLMSISNTLPSSNGVEPSNPGLDMNREAGSLKQFFIPGRSNLMEEQIKAASQQSTSATPPLKRKEPDSGWEPYGFGYNQVVPGLSPQLPIRYSPLIQH